MNEIIDVTLNEVEIRNKLKELGIDTQKIGSGSESDSDSDDDLPEDYIPEDYRDYNSTASSNTDSENEETHNQTLNQTKMADFWGISFEAEQKINYNLETQKD